MSANHRALHPGLCAPTLTSLWTPFFNFILMNLGGFKESVYLKADESKKIQLAIDTRSETAHSYILQRSTRQSPVSVNDWGFYSLSSGARRGRHLSLCDEPERRRYLGRGVRTGQDHMEWGPRFYLESPELPMRLAGPRGLEPSR